MVHLILLYLFALGLLPMPCSAWFTPRAVAQSRYPTKLQLQRFDDQLVASLKSNDTHAGVGMLADFDCHLLEFDDLRSACTLSANGFFKSKLQDKADPDNPAVKLFMRTEWLDAWLSNYLGYWNRCGKRLRSPSLDVGPSPAIIVATPHGSDELAVIVELGLEPVNGILPYPLRFFPASDAELVYMQPYISNLSVAQKFRRKGLGRFMCQLCEAIAVRLWNRSEVYLHVEESNVEARQLYDTMGYEVVEVLTEKEKLANGMNGLIYYRKWLNNRQNATSS